MTTRRQFIARSTAAAASALLWPGCTGRSLVPERLGIQLYTFRAEMAADPMGTLRTIAALGFKEIESARSEAGHYYGLGARGMKQACEDLGMVLRSGHVRLDDDFESTVREAVESGQEYLICSSLPTRGQTIANYRSVAEAFNRAGERCQQAGVKFGYHNHAYEFESEGGTVLFDVLLDQTDPALVHMEMDLGWVIVGGGDPLDYFARYPGRFPLWHLKDMDMQAGQSTEFGRGGLDIAAMMTHASESGVKHIFVEQEEYAEGPGAAMRHNLDYLRAL